MTDGSDMLVAMDNVSVIVRNTIKAIGLGRWYSADKAAPDTVEFWLLMFVKRRKQKGGGAPHGR
jgi:hypothetical protein